MASTQLERVPRLFQARQMALTLLRCEMREVACARLSGRAAWAPACWRVAPVLCSGRTSGGAAACRLRSPKRPGGRSLVQASCGASSAQGGEDPGSHGGLCSSALSPVSEPSFLLGLSAVCGGAGFEPEG